MDSSISFLLMSVFWDSDTTNLIFETTDMQMAAPSTLSRCTIVHCGEGTTTWSGAYYSWKQTAGTKYLLTSLGYVVFSQSS